ncbi:hypothetical protein ACNKHR_09960 [Shigella flexneri]
MTDCSHRFFARVNKAGTPVAGADYRRYFDDHLPAQQHFTNVTKEFGSVFRLGHLCTVPYLYTCAALLLLGHGHFGKARPAYLAVTTIAFLYCIWAVAGLERKRLCGHSSP